MITSTMPLFRYQRWQLTTERLMSSRWHVTSYQVTRQDKVKECLLRRRVNVSRQQMSPLLWTSMNWRTILMISIYIVTPPWSNPISADQWSPSRGCALVLLRASSGADDAMASAQTPPRTTRPLVVTPIWGPHGGKMRTAIRNYTWPL